MVKLQSKTNYTRAREITLPIVGNVTFSEDNCIFVEDDKVDALLEMNCGIKLVKVGKAKEKDVESPENKSEFFNEDKQALEIETKKETLSALSMEELNELLKEFPEKETKFLKNKKSIINFLAHKI